MKRAAIAPLALGFGLAVAVTACGPTHSASMSPSDKAAVEQAKAQYAQIAFKCGIADAAGQITAIRELRTHDGRDKLMAKCGIPPANRTATEAKLLQAAEHAHLTKHDGRVSYFTVTVPRIVSQEQA